MEKLVRDYTNAVKAELDAAIALEANFNEETFKATLNTGERTLITREYIRFCAGFAGSPPCVRDLVLDLAYGENSLALNYPEVQYLAKSSLIESIKQRVLGCRLLDYSFLGPVPDKAVGYAGGYICVGSFRLQAEPFDLLYNLTPLLPVSDNTTRYLIAGVFHMRGDPVPEAFNGSDRSLQESALSTYFARMY